MFSIILYRGLLITKSPFGCRLFMAKLIYISDLNRPMVTSAYTFLRHLLPNGDRYLFKCNLAYLPVYTCIQHYNLLTNNKNCGLSKAIQHFFCVRTLLFLIPANLLDFLLSLFLDFCLLSAYFPSKCLIIDKLTFKWGLSMWG